MEASDTTHPNLGPGACPSCGTAMRPEPGGGEHCPRCGPLIAVLWRADGTGADVRVGLVGSFELGAIDRLIQKAGLGPAGRIVLDFERVTFLPSASLGSLVAFQGRIGAGGRGLTIRGVRPDVREVLRITHLDDFLDIQT